MTARRRALFPHPAGTAGPASSAMPRRVVKPPASVAAPARIPRRRATGNRTIACSRHVGSESLTWYHVKDKGNPPIDIRRA
jgi:hypothetical protein